MQRLSQRQLVSCALASLVSFGLAGPALFITGTILLDLRFVAGGLVAWAGVFALLFLGIGAIGFLIAILSLYARDVRRGRFARTFFTVLSVQFFAYPVLHALSKVEHSSLSISLLDIFIGGTGLGLGSLFAVLAARSPAHTAAHPLVAHGG